MIRRYLYFDTRKLSLECGRQSRVIEAIDDYHITLDNILIIRYEYLKILLIYKYCSDLMSD